jgi:hypothetical protein
MQRRGLGLLMAAAAAYGYFKYRKMTPEQKRDIQQRGKHFMDKNLRGLNSLFGKRTETTNSRSGGY